MASELFNYLNLPKRKETLEYEDIISKLMNQKGSFLINNIDNIYYNFCHCLRNYIHSRFNDDTNVSKEVELKNYSTFNVKIQIELSNNYLIYKPYSSAIDRYVILEIIIPFLNNKTIENRSLEKIIVIHNLEKISFKYHKYLSHLIKMYQHKTQFIYTSSSHNQCVSNQILEKIFILNVPLWINDDIELFWEKKKIKINWKTQLDIVFNTFFREYRRKTSDHKHLRKMLAEIYTSNVPSSNIIEYIIENIDNYNFNKQNFDKIFEEIAKVEYYLKVGNRFIFHLEYLITFLQQQLLYV